MKITGMILAFGLLLFNSRQDTKESLLLKSGPVKVMRTDQNSGTLGRLQESEELTIYFSSFGCFSHSARKLVFTRSAEGIRLVVYDGQVRYGKEGQQPSMEQGKLLQEKLMTDTDLSNFAVFEKELTRRRDGGCTTSETYTMVSKYGTLSVTDASCRWFGMNQLMTDLFGKTI